ncbi:PadR family transcriptional regulator [Antricoccus suffuscus]|uniref:PadR family transcriptional regulator n=1 Tax=Antricoccus suffuscus TaxID=1629062 RepID=A0A2T1A7G5_9ACTN|nr:PadR family transcriptional regulator [Antricoccus suffuscus]
MARSRSNPLALAILSCLSEQPMHPYQISATLKHRNKEASIRLNYGSLYSVVGSLLKQGLIAEHGTSQDGNRPQRTIYAITPEGETELVDWMRELIRMPVKEYPALEAGLALLPVLSPDTVVALLGERLDRLRASIEQEQAGIAEAAQMGLPQVLSIEGEYAVALLRAERDFVESLIKSIDSKQIGGYEFWARMHQLRDEGVSLADLTRNPEKYFAAGEVTWMALDEAPD